MLSDQNRGKKNITVIIPAYNAASFLPSCLESVLSQSCPPAEILVVDDCSADHTNDILSQYPVRSMCLPRRMGAAYARVAGARAATGDIVAFLDADCVAGTDWLHELSQALTGDVAGVGGGYRFDEKHNLFETFIARLARDWFSRKQPEGRAILIGGNSAFRRDVFVGRELFLELSNRQHYASGDDTLLCLELLEKHHLNYLPHLPVTHQPYGVTGFFRRQARWARSRTLLFLNRPVKQKAELASGQMLKILLQIAISGLLVVSGVFSFFSPWSPAGLPLFLLSLLLFIVWHQQSLSIMTGQKRSFFEWVPAAIFLWIRNLCFIVGITNALVTRVVDSGSGLFDKLVLAYNLIHPRRLFKIYVFVTNRCNRRCEFCFYRDNLGNNDDQDLLSLSDCDKISENLPLIPYVTLTGGEPFLRGDLDQIGLLFYRKNRTRFMVIPTNGTMPGETEELLERLLIDAPKLNLTIQVSLNGLEQYLLTGGDSAEAAVSLDTWNRLGRLQARFKRLRRHLSLVITRDNSADLQHLAEQIPSQLQPDHFFVTPQRSGPNDVALPHISIEEFVEVLQKQPVTNQPGFFDRVYKMVYEKVRREFINVYKLKKMPSPCLAGKKFFVVDPAGQIQLCELIDDKNGSIIDYKWKDIQKKNVFKKAVKKIRQEDCVCTWGCAIVSNTIHRFPLWFIEKKLPPE